MDLEVARKTLSKRNAFSSKRIAFLAVAGVALVVGIALRSGQYFGQPEAEQNAPVNVAAPPAATPSVDDPEASPATQEAEDAPSQQAEQAGEAVEESPPVTGAAPPSSAATPPMETTEPTRETSPPAQETEIAPSEQPEQAGAEQPEPPGGGMILVSRRPVEVLANPSASAPTMYGFPAGRPFRVIGREAGFAQILDLKSGATGWIDEAALAPPPPVPTVSRPSQPKPAAVGQKPAKPSTSPPAKATKKDSQTTADSEAAAEPDPAQARRRPGLFGRGGIFGGIFSN